MRLPESAALANQAQCNYVLIIEASLLVDIYLKHPGKT